MAYKNDLQLAYSSREIASQEIRIIDSTVFNDQASRTYSEARRRKYQRLLMKSDERVAEIKSRITEDIGAKKLQLEEYKTEYGHVSTRHKLGEISLQECEKQQNIFQTKYDQLKQEAVELDRLIATSNASEVGGQIPIDIDKEVDDYGNINRNMVAVNTPSEIKTPHIEKEADIKDRVTEGITAKKDQLEECKTEYNRIGTLYKRGEISLQECEKQQNALQKQYDQVKQEAVELERLLTSSPSLEIGRQRPIDVEREGDDHRNINRNMAAVNTPSEIKAPPIEKAADVKDRITEEIATKKLQSEEYKTEYNHIDTRYKRGETSSQEYEKRENILQKQYDQVKQEDVELEPLPTSSTSSEIGRQHPIDTDKKIDEYGNINRKKSKLNIPSGIKLPNIETFKNIKKPNFESLSNVKDSLNKKMPNTDALSNMKNINFGSLSNVKDSLSDTFSNAKLPHDISTQGQSFIHGIVEKFKDSLHLHTLSGPVENVMKNYHDKGTRGPVFMGIFMDKISKKNAGHNNKAFSINEIPMKSNLGSDNAPMMVKDGDSVHVVASRDIWGDDFTVYALHNTATNTRRDYPFLRNFILAIFIIPSLFYGGLYLLRFFASYSLLLALVSLVITLCIWGLIPVLVSELYVGWRANRMIQGFQ